METLIWDRKTTYSEPRWPGLLDNRVLGRRVLSDSMQPRVPFRCSLRSVKVILGVIDPSLSSYPISCVFGVYHLQMRRLTWDLFTWVHVLKVSISKLIGTDMTTEFGISDVPSSQTLYASRGFFRLLPKPAARELDSRHLPEPLLESDPPEVPYRSC
jgi:hypothetical protein